MMLILSIGDVLLCLPVQRYKVYKASAYKAANIVVPWCHQAVLQVQVATADSAPSDKFSLLRTPAY